MSVWIKHSIIIVLVNIDHRAPPVERKGRGRGRSQPAKGVRHRLIDMSPSCQLLTPIVIRSQDERGGRGVAELLDAACMAATTGFIRRSQGEWRSHAFISGETVVKG